MTIGKGRLTPKQRAFAQHYASTGDTHYAAAKAGIARPELDGARMLHHEGVRNAVAIEFRQRLGNVLVKGLARCEAMLDDPKTPNKDVINITRVAATAYRGEAADEAGKDPAEMTGAEIQARLQRLQHEAAARAKPVLEGELTEADDLSDSVFE